MYNRTNARRSRTGNRARTNTTGSTTGRLDGRVTNRRGTQQCRANSDIGSSRPAPPRSLAAAAPDSPHRTTHKIIAAQSHAVPRHAALPCITYVLLTHITYFSRAVRTSHAHYTSPAPLQASCARNPARWGPQGGSQHTGLTGGCTRVTVQHVPCPSVLLHTP